MPLLMPSASILIHHSQLAFMQQRKFSTSNKARSFSNLAVNELHIKVKAVLFFETLSPSRIGALS
jgi:hypothetical protein